VHRQNPEIVSIENYKNEASSGDPGGASMVAETAGIYMLFRQAGIPEAVTSIQSRE